MRDFGQLQCHALHTNVYGTRILIPARTRQWPQEANVPTVSTPSKPPRETHQNRLLPSSVLDIAHGPIGYLIPREVPSRDPNAAMWFGQGGRLDIVLNEMDLVSKRDYDTSVPRSSSTGYSLVDYEGLARPGLGLGRYAYRTHQPHQSQGEWESETLTAVQGQAELRPPSLEHQFQSAYSDLYQHYSQPSYHQDLGASPSTDLWSPSQHLDSLQSMKPTCMDTIRAADYKVIKPKHAKTFFVPGRVCIRDLRHVIKL